VLAGFAGLLEITAASCVFICSLQRFTASLYDRVLSADIRRVMQSIN
jgi:hypothetical protein